MEACLGGHLGDWLYLESPVYSRFYDLLVPLTKLVFEQTWPFSSNRTTQVKMITETMGSYHGFGQKPT